MLYNVGMSKEAIANHAEKWTQTQNFVRRAVRDGAHRRDPRVYPSRVQGLDGWIWKKTVVGTYAWTEASLDDIAQVYGITRQGVGLAFKAGIETLHRQSSQKTQKDFPLEEIVFSKPTTLLTKDRMSLAHGGMRVKARKLLSQGISGQDLRDRLGIDSSRLAELRKVFGCEALPKIIRGEKYKQLERDLRDPNLSSEEVKDLLQKVDFTFYQGQVALEDPVVVTISKLLKAMDISVLDSKERLFARRVLVDTFQAEGIPVGVLERKSESAGGRKLRLYLIWVGHIPCAIDCLQRMSIT